MKVLSIWTKQYLIFSKTRVKCVSRIHHPGGWSGDVSGSRIRLSSARWLGNAWFKSDKIFNIFLVSWRLVIAFLYVFLFRSILILLPFFLWQYKGNNERTKNKEIFTRTWVWGLVLRVCVRSVRVWNVRVTSSACIYQLLWWVDAYALEVTRTFHTRTLHTHTLSTRPHTQVLVNISLFLALSFSKNSDFSTDMFSKFQTHNQTVNPACIGSEQKMIVPNKSFTRSSQWFCGLMFLLKHWFGNQVVKYQRVSFNFTTSVPGSNFVSSSACTLLPLWTNRAFLLKFALFILFHNLVVS